MSEPSANVTPLLGVDQTASTLVADTELTAASAGLRDARYRVHGAALVLLSRVVTADYPRAEVIVVDTALRWYDPIGPTLVHITDGRGEILAEDNIGSKPIAPVLAARVHQLLATGTSDASLADLGWQLRPDFCWQHALVPPELRSDTWRFVATGHDPAAPWACSYARADCPRCAGLGRPSTRNPLWLCGCTRDVR